MSHWIVAPIVLPALMAGALVLALGRNAVTARAFSLLSVVAQLAIAVGLMVSASSNPPQVYELGNWPAPYGIVMVLDRLSAMMLVLTAVLAVVVLAYASRGWDRRGRHFHALFQFQLMGLNGAFLTGDVFNLFVFFEVLLISSYGLMLHGSGPERLRHGTHYVVVNLTGSALFLIGVGLIYGATGTLNMADLAVKVPLVEAGDQAILQTGGLLLLLVFCVKAALVPLHFWLPGTYAAASAPVAALFAVMTKVGAYSILRVYTLVFGAGAGEAAWLAQPWLIPAALATLIVGVLGMLGARDLSRLVAFSVVASMGTLLAAVGGFTPASVGAALYYLLHSTVITAGLFLLVEQIGSRRGEHGGRIDLAPRFERMRLLATLFFLAGIASAGLPPLSGFVGKLLILDGLRNDPAMATIWSVILATSLVMVLAYARAGSLLFWKSTAVEGSLPGPSAASGAAADGPPGGRLPLLATGLLIGLTLLLSVFAGPVQDYLAKTTLQLFDPGPYLEAVLGPEGQRRS